MHSRDFSKHLDTFTDEWILATETAIFGHKVKEEPDVEGAFPVVLKFKKCYTTCSWCGEPEIKGKTYTRSINDGKKWRGKCLDCKEIRFLTNKDLNNNK